VLAETGQWPQARQQFLEAIAIDAAHVPARNALAVLDEIESRFGVHGNRR
jgi:hypothetical protein